MRQFAIAFLAFCGLPPAALADISGFYVDADRFSVSVLHLVESETGELVGRFEKHHLDESGEVDSDSFLLKGNASGDHFVIAPSHGLGALAGASFSGTRRTDGLVLMWEEGEQTFSQASPAERADLLAALRTMSDHVKIALAKEEAQSEFARALAHLDALKEHQPAVATTFEHHIKEATVLQAEISNLYRTSTGLRNSSAAWSEVEAVEADLALVRADYRRLRTTVELTRNRLNETASEVIQALAIMDEYCKKHESLRSLCDQRQHLRIEFDAVVNEFQPAFVRWDATIGQ